MGRLWESLEIERTTRGLQADRHRCTCTCFNRPTQMYMQARRQEFPEGGSSTRVALTAGGLGAAQGLGYLEQNPEI